MTLNEAVQEIIRQDPMPDNSEQRAIMTQLVNDEHVLAMALSAAIAFAEGNEQRDRDQVISKFRNAIIAGMTVGVQVGQLLGVGK